jgi:chemotaxis protein MotB
MSENGSLNGSLVDSYDYNEWMITYADLVTLLLVFFILLYSISSLNLEKFKRAVQSIQTSLGETNPKVGLLELADVAESKDQSFTIEDLTGLRAREQDMLKSLNEMIADKNQSENILVYAKDGKIIIQIRGTVLFSSGSAEFSDNAVPILNEIVNIIQTYPEYNVNIKGHTDDIPIETPQFPSNWELSAVRATTVLKFLISGGINPHRLTATGYGELLPLVSNDSTENRAINRRVEFVLEKRDK